MRHAPRKAVHSPDPAILKLARALARQLEAEDYAAQMTAQNGETHEPRRDLRPLLQRPAE